MITLTQEIMKKKFMGRQTNIRKLITIIGVSYLMTGTLIILLTSYMWSDLVSMKFLAWPAVILVFPIIAHYYTPEEVEFDGGNLIVRFAMSTFVMKIRDITVTECISYRQVSKKIESEKIEILSEEYKDVTIEKGLFTDYDSLKLFFIEKGLLEMDS